MYTRSEIREAVKDEVNAQSSDTFFTDAYINRKIDQMYRKVASKYDWPETELAMIRDSEAGEEYLNLPENLKVKSITKVKYNEETYEPINFEDYLAYKEEEGDNATDKISAFYENKIFLNPTPTDDIVGGIEIYGHFLPDRLAGDSSYTIFKANEDIEEIIIKLTVGECRKKADKSQFASGRALQKEAWDELKEIWNQTKRRKAREQNKGSSMLQYQQLIPTRGFYQRGTFESQ